eukprot:COSAG03_NODE_23416_length_280_cov_0.629834_1_plen_82_part_01
MTGKGKRLQAPPPTTGKMAGNRRAAVCVFAHQRAHDDARPRWVADLILVLLVKAQGHLLAALRQRTADDSLARRQAHPSLPL